MKKAKKTRPRGGATYPCPHCGARSRVAETRLREPLPGAEVPYVIRWRTCRRYPSHKFTTLEVKADV